MAEKTEGIGLSRIGQIGVTVRDLKKMVVYYRDTLGMKLMFEVPGMAFFECGPIRLMLGLPEKPELAHPSSILYYMVEDIHSAHRVLSGRGVKFSGEPRLVARLADHDLYLAEFRDLEDNPAALMSEVRR
jgi:catechol 2,3-dioxygenase-like lactoylglutathione lyase family enzyme